jgi:hypothetical protein
MEGDDQQVHQRPHRVHHLRAARNVEQIVGERVGREADQAHRRHAVAPPDGIDGDPPQRPVHPKAEAVEQALGRLAAGRSVVVGVVVGEVEVGEPRLDQPGGERGRRAEGVAAGPSGRGVDHRTACALSAYRPLGRAEALALVRGAGIGQDALEVADDQVAHQRGAGRIEQAATAVGRDAVGQGRGAEIDVSDHGQAQARGLGRRWRGRNRRRQGWGRRADRRGVRRRLRGGRGRRVAGAGRRAGQGQREAGPADHAGSAWESPPDP